MNNEFYSLDCLIEQHISELIAKSGYVHNDQYILMRASMLRRSLEHLADEENQ